MRNQQAKISSYILAILLSILFLFPIVWVILLSFKNGSELFRYPPTLLPSSPTIQNYIDTFAEGNFSLFFGNSAVVAVLSTILCVVINTMAGYAFAKYRFPGRNIIFFIFISTLMMPMEVLMVPIFQIIQKLGMYNTFAGLIIPPAATPTGVFIMRQFFLSIPDELMEASRIDGASETSIFLRIMIPLAKPAMTVLVIFSVMWRWNDYLWPLIVIRDTDLYTVQLALQSFSGENTIDWECLLAMSVITMIPVLIIFLIFQKQFIQGISTSGLKDS